MERVTQTIKLGSHNARGLVDESHARAGVGLGCTRITSLDKKLKHLYDAFLNSEHPLHDKSIALHDEISRLYAEEHANLYSMQVEIAKLTPSDNFFNPPDTTKDLIVTLSHPLAWQAIRLLKTYDEMILSVQFLASVGHVSLDKARKYRDRAGKPVRRFLTNATNLLSSAELAVAVA